MPLLWLPVLLLLSTGCRPEIDRTQSAFEDRDVPETIRVDTVSVENTITPFFSSGAITPGPTGASSSEVPEEDSLSHLAHLESALEFADIKEEPINSNRGPAVDQFLDAVGLKPAGTDKGPPWCAAFVAFCLNDTDNVVSPPKQVRTAWARGYIIRSGIATHKSIRMQEVLRGTVKIEPGTLVIWKAKPDPEDVSGHIGMVVEWDDNCKGEDFCSGKTIEGNTSSGRQGSQRDGGGVYQRTRTIHLQPANHFRITHFTPVKYQQ